MALLKFCWEAFAAPNSAYTSEAFAASGGVYVYHRALSCIWPVYKTEPGAALRDVYTAGACADLRGVYTTEAWACIWTCLRYRGLCCSWRCLHKRGLRCTWKCLHHRILCCSWTCLHYTYTSLDNNFCYPDLVSQTEFVHIANKVFAICAWIFCWVFRATVI